MKCKTVSHRSMVAIVGIACVVAVAGTASAQSPAGTPQIEIEVRPFAIFADSLLQNTDGWFDAAFGVQKIGVFLKNTGSDAGNVTGTISFPPESGIVGTETTYFFGNMGLDVSVLGIFEADFSSAAPEKYSFTITLTGDDGFSAVLSRNAFVAKTTVLGPRSSSVQTPQGTLVVEYLSFFGGSQVESLMAPTHVTLTLTPTAPFPGQFSEIPYEDPWWKPFGLGMAIGSLINMAADGIVELCGSDYMDPATEKINAALGGSGALAAASDVIDPFRRGEENTFPLAEELTTGEEVDMTTTYDQPPVAQQPFTGTVAWTFTRFTTGNTYLYNVNEPFQNEHYSTSRSAATDKTIYRLSGDTILLTSQVTGPQGLLRRGSDAYVVAQLSWKESNQRKHLVRSVILHDDGTNGDEVAGDGTYSGTVLTDGSFPASSYIYDVLAQDINHAAVTDPPLIAATNIGGFLVGHPMPAISVASAPGAECGQFSDGLIYIGIPTVSQWGLIILALLLLTGGTLVVGRQRRRPVLA